MTAYICDWTHWQGIPLPASGVADEGFAMVKLKAGGATREGRYYEDPSFFDSAQATLAEPRLVPAAYWYLMPGRAWSQAGLFLDILNLVGGANAWGCFLDVEETGVRWADVSQFRLAWELLTIGKPLMLYTRKTFWETIGAQMMGAELYPFLEEAHWVSSAIRADTSRPYASQHAKGIDPAWWNVNYGGWNTAQILQFTDTALVQGKHTVASLYRGTKAELRALVGIV